MDRIPAKKIDIASILSLIELEYLKHKSSQQCMVSAGIFSMKYFYVLFQPSKIIKDCMYDAHCTKDCAVLKVPKVFEHDLPGLSLILSLSHQMVRH